MSFFTNELNRYMPIAIKRIMDIKTLGSAGIPIIKDKLVMILVNTK